MFADMSIIAMTPISMVPFIPELQNLVFEFIHGSTALYTHKLRFAPVLEDLSHRLRFKRAVEEKVNDLFITLANFMDQGYVRSASMYNAENTYQYITAAEYRRELRMIPSKLCDMVFEIEWTDLFNGPQFVQVWYSEDYGSIYMTQQFFPADDEDGAQQREHLTLADFLEDLARSGFE
jgi:hypothetical protein